MGGSAKKEGESNGENGGKLRLLRGWVHYTPGSAQVLAEKQHGRIGDDSDGQMIEESFSLQDQIDRARRTVRALMGSGREGPSWVREENEQLASENARLWRAVGHLAEALDLLSERLEILERRRPRVRGSRSLAG